jgi:hypothetical protein
VSVSCLSSRVAVLSCRVTLSCRVCDVSTRVVCACQSVVSCLCVCVSSYLAVRQFDITNIYEYIYNGLLEPPIETSKREKSDLCRTTGSCSGEIITSRKKSVPQGDDRNAVQNELFVNFETRVKEALREQNEDEASPKSDKGNDTLRYGSWLHNNGGFSRLCDFVTTPRIEKGKEMTGYWGPFSSVALLPAYVLSRNNPLAKARVLFEISRLTRM